MLETERAADVAARNQGRRALVQVDLRGRGPDREMLAIASDHAHGTTLL
jgi:hypothetical protein